jgi:cytoskeletal protein RodZ
VKSSSVIRHERSRVAGDSVHAPLEEAEVGAFPVEPHASLITESVGATLRRQREKQRMGLAEVARITRIPKTTIEHIELDQFDDLPGEIFVKGFLKSYARAVGLVPDEILARFTTSRRLGMAARTPLPVVSSVHAARGGQRHRFGVAIALVLLLILFTLALSIVLKPRGRDMPRELSLNDAHVGERSCDVG